MPDRWSLGSIKQIGASTRVIGEVRRLWKTQQSCVVRRLSGRPLAAICAARAYLHGVIQTKETVLRMIEWEAGHGCGRG